MRPVRPATCPRLEKRRRAAGRPPGRHKGGGGLSGSEKGVLWALGSVVFITALGLVVKHMGQIGVSVSTIVLFQGLLIWTFTIPLLARKGAPAFRTRRLPLHALRSVLSLGSFSGMVYALANLNLADAVALSFSIPLWSIPLSVLFLGEGVKLRRWVATAIGFAGILCIVRPGANFEWAMLVALVGAASGSGAKISTKKLTTTEGILQIMFYYSLIATLLVLPVGVWFWQPLGSVQVGWLLVSGFLGFAGQYCMAKGFALADMTIVAPMDFIRMPLSAVLGIFLFSEIPDFWTVVGITIIGAASIYIVRREAAQRRRGAPASSLSAAAGSKGPDQ